MDIPDELFDAIKKQETGNEKDPLTAVGDEGRSIGPFQIMKSYWADAAEYDDSLKDNGGSWEKTQGPGSVEYSKRVIQAYMNKYATEARLGRPPTYEDIARIHNGGPNGYKKDSTKKYWEYVERNLGN